MTSNILVQQDHGILVIQINRPEKRNALTQSMYQSLNESLALLESDPNLVVGLIHGTEGCFTSGNDLKDFIQCQSPADFKEVTDFLSNLGKISKPFIAAVEGPAVGIGTTLLAHCDLVYASSDAYFQTPFVNLGISPEAGSSLLFPLQMGHHRAAECLLLSERFSAQQAYDWGLINQIILDKPVIEHSLAQAKKLTQKPRQSLLTAKRLLRKSSEQELAKVIANENRALFELLNTDETKAIMTSTFNKIKS